MEWNAPGPGRLPREELDTLVKAYGPPSCIDKRRGGGAFWLAKDLAGTPFWRVEIVDETFLHGQPDRHAEFLTAGIPFVERKATVELVTTFSKSLWFDALGQVLYARGDSGQRVWALLALAVNVAQHNIKPQQTETAKGRKTVLSQFVRSARGLDQQESATARFRHMVEAYVVKITRQWQRAKRTYRM